MRRRLPHLLGLLAGLAGLAGCGGTSDHALRLTLGALHAGPPAAAPTSSAAGRPGCDASLRPPRTLPAPGAMPAGSFMATIARRRRLIVGVDQNSLLLSYLNPADGQLEGFEIDVLRQIAKAIFGDPRAIEFRAITTAQRVPIVQSGAVDIVADAVTITCARAALVSFSTDYFDGHGGFLVAKNSPVRHVADLSGRRICATTASTSIERVLALRPRAIAYPVSQRTDCLVALQQGDVDAIASDQALLLGFQAQDPYTRFVSQPSSHAPYGTAISRAHPDFVRFVNGVLRQIRADGTWRAIWSRWLGPIVGTSAPAPPAAHYAR